MWAIIEQRKSINNNDWILLLLWYESYLVILLNYDLLFGCYYHFEVEVFLQCVHWPFLYKGDLHNHHSGSNFLNHIEKSIHIYYSKRFGRHHSIWAIVLALFFICYWNSSPHSPGFFVEIITDSFWTFDSSENPSSIYFLQKFWNITWILKMPDDIGGKF